MSRIALKLPVTMALVLLTAAPVFAQGVIPIEEIKKGGITPDGHVAGQATDFIINLDIPRDDTPGLSLPAGDMMEIIVPPAFVNNRMIQNNLTLETGPATTQTPFASNSCTPGNLFCNTSVFIQGWPQRPLLPVFPPANPASPDDFQFDTAYYELSNGENENVFVHTALLDVGPGGPPPGPGIKQIHMLLPGFTNPIVSEPTDYTIQVRHTRMVEGEKVIIAQGADTFTVLPEMQPNVNLVSLFDPMRRNTVYQTVEVGETPVPYDFYLWDGNAQPYLGVSISGSDVVDDQDNIIGRISIMGPDGAMGQNLTSLGPSTDVEGGDAFFRRDVARLSAQFMPGDLLGEYVTTIALFDKNDIGMENPRVISSERLTVNVVPEPSVGCGALLALMLLVASTMRRTDPTGSTC